MRDSEKEKDLVKKREIYRKQKGEIKREREREKAR